MKSYVESLIENHPLLPLISILIQVSVSESLQPELGKRLSYELIRVTPFIMNDSHGDQSYGKAKIDHVMKRTVANLLKTLGNLLGKLFAAEETFKILIAANEQFKRTRRRLPPQAESDLAEWLLQNRAHPYPTEEFIGNFCEKFDGIEEDQVRIFLTNARRKMTEGVRKRSKSH